MFNIENDGITNPNTPEAISPDNSSLIALGVSATFTGKGILTAGLVSFTTIISTDKDGILKLQSSSDNIVWNTDRTIMIDAENNRTAIENIAVQDTYFRVIYENNSIAQTEFRLQCISHRDSSIQDSILLGDGSFKKITGIAAKSNLSRKIIDVNDVKKATVVGYIRIEIEDKGNRISDQDYFIPIYTLA